MNSGRLYPELLDWTGPLQKCFCELHLVCCHPLLLGIIIGRSLMKSVTVDIISIISTCSVSHIIFLVRTPRRNLSHFLIMRICKFAEQITLLLFPVNFTLLSWSLVIVQLLSHVPLFATPWTAARQASLSFTISWSLIKLMSMESVMPSNHPILCRPFLLLPSIFPSTRVFSNESALHIRWPKYWSFSISPSSEYSGLVSFRMDWFDLPEVQWTRKSLLQHHSSKASILQHSAFFMVQLSHPYMTTEKTTALTRWTFVGKVMSLLFNMLFWFVIAFFQEVDRWKANNHVCSPPLIYHNDFVTIAFILSLFFFLISFHI